MSPSRPNILIYLTDQQRGDHLSIAGHPNVETPHSDSLVGRGAYFPNAYAEVPSTTAGHRILLTGKEGFAAGNIGYTEKEWLEPRDTLPYILADHGYHCFCMGWRNLHPQRKLYGFHTVLPVPILRDPDRGEYADWLRREGGASAFLDGHGIGNNAWIARPSHLPERLHAVAWTIDSTIEQIERRDPTRPFFVWCSHYPPHSPYTPPQPYWDMYAGREIPEPPRGDWAKRFNVPLPAMPIQASYGKLPAEQQRRMRIGYMGSCTHVDYEFGRLLTRLQYMGLLDNTLILRLSDHGDMQGDHYMLRKRHPYEGSARIVFLAQYPRGMGLPSGTFPHVVGLQDVMPTILEAAGIECPEGVTGRSIFRAVRGEPWREFFHGEHAPNADDLRSGHHYLTDGKEKYIWRPCTGEEEFFDLSKDRRELRNLAKDPKRAKRVALWRKRMVDLLAKRGDGFSDGKKLLRRPNGWSAEVK
ncbi:MAG: sulfatase-like hydrolase/transferase [Candidatus Sumerlaeota bacterium]|nr:sulfatase-like hydrolase/transferase [Candidatus Sumerlaeota bacterium]